MDTTKQPGINCDSIILIESKFIRYPSEPNIDKLDIKFSSEVYLYEGKNSGGTKLVCEITDSSEDEGSKLLIKVAFLGQFSTQIEKKNMIINDFLNLQAKAIILPYIREHVAALSIKAGLKPIILPPVNILALEKNL